ncbi:hypothetical protein DSECCO2_423090 [anaerobic digester metagenome]
MTIASTSLFEHLSSSAIKLAKRPASRTPLIPKTFSGSKPVAFIATYVMISSGFVTFITIEFGAYFAMFPATSPIIFEFVLIRSSLLIPGFLAIPAVIITRSAFAISA